MRPPHGSERPVSAADTSGEDDGVISRGPMPSRLDGASWDVGAPITPIPGAMPCCEKNKTIFSP